MFKTLAAFCIFILVVACPVLAQRGPETGAIVGTVKDEHGNSPARRLEVRLGARGGVVAVQYTDTEGRFSFSDLPANAYHVTIDDEEYVPFAETVMIGIRNGQTEYLQIRLDHRKKDKTDSSEVQPGANPFMVDVKGLQAAYPHDAVKAFEAGTKALERNRSEHAIKDFAKAVEIAPGFYQARNNLGTLYLNLSDFKDAEEQFSEVLKLQQSDAAAYFNLGNVLLLTKRYPEAEKLLQDGLRKQPNSAMGQFLMGTLYCRIGRTQEGEKALISAAGADPSMSRIHLELVNLYLTQGRKDDALQQLNFFVTAYPTDPMVGQVKQVLARL